MGKTVKNPKRFIVSCRVDDKEMVLLQERAQACGSSISELLRDSLNIDGQDYRQSA